MKKYWIYIGKRNDGLIDCKYFSKELNPVPDYYEFVGTAELKEEYFGTRVVDKFKKLFDDYADKKYLSLIHKTKKVKEKYFKMKNR